MSRVRHSDTELELGIRRLLYARGGRGYRLRIPIPGKPDIVYTRARLAIFIDGCFWHGCPECYTRPATRQEFWDTKLAQNKARDKAVDKALRVMGWHVIHFWGHEVKEDPEQIAAKIIDFLASNTS